MGKRLLAVALCLCLMWMGIPVYGEEEVLEAAAPVDQLPARSAILIDQASGRVLYEKEPDLQLPPASITKVMTLLLVMEAIQQGKLSLDTEITTSSHAASMGGSQIWLKEGETMSVDDLLKATAISSANDAAVALAEAVAGSEEAFVAQMNQKAKELGMSNTQFYNATGLDAQGHLSSARDVATMCQALLNYPLITNYSSVWMDELRDGKTQLVNTNKLVRFYDGCTGLKTGTTDGAGSCLAASATRNGLSLVAVTMGSATSVERFSAARGLLDYGFSNYCQVELPVPEGLNPVRVVKGMEPMVQVVCEPPGSVMVKTADKDKIEQNVVLEESVEAPVESGQLLGRVIVTANKEPICEYRLVAADPVERRTFGRALALLGEYLMSL